MYGAHPAALPPCSSHPDPSHQVAELGVPYVVMHMRGDPGTMARAEHTAYGSSGGVWRGVGAELQTAAERAEAAGVPAWSIILDPGKGATHCRGPQETLCQIAMRTPCSVVQSGIKSMRWHHS